MSVPGSDDTALRRALTKLEAALGSREAIGVDVDAPPSLTAVRQAGDAGQPVEIDYHSASRDELTTRVVEPVQVITMDGHWYLDAYCRRAGDMRRFRVDRIGAVRPHAEERESTARVLRTAEDAFLPGPGAVEVQLRLGKGAQWVPESVPVRAVGRSGDGMVTDVVLDVAGLAWFERLLLQLGTEASVVRPPELVDLAARAARRVLRLYQKDIE
jgi:proteasome accessory factor C